MSNNNSLFLLYHSLHGTIINRACKFKVLGRLFSQKLPHVMQSARVQI